MTTELHFFIGKGGVGKSTTAALNALGLAQKGMKTLLASMDPAHNQGDIFQTKFSDKPRQVCEHLSVLEVDLDLWIKKSLKETARTIKRKYSYESAFNLEKHFDVLQFSPGVEEYALLLAFEKILSANKDKEIIIFDMAPTALTLRFFSLPFITLIWLSSLLAVREEIYTKKEIISKITIGRKHIEQDTVRSKLASMIATHNHLKDRFISNGTRIKLVINEDKLSFAEAFRIKAKLDQIGMQVETVIINKALQKIIPTEVRRVFREQRFRFFPLSPNALMGITALTKYVQQNEPQFIESTS